ncbi:receptor-type tyrosine-protein phosphatase V-like isoform X1 [Acipenser ruthenus]|uniref:receptor-type tyrosine-protein phosphatase V-like isoform X1 n=1 Tax=Acipenser ruthenus TaxID=7906 RepID=UPI002740C1BC|nr:receptor-type tyrosine-protein phosphatase V-like isoform X1 [Acipenser ruthenus]
MKSRVQISQAALQNSKELPPASAPFHLPQPLPYPQGKQQTPNNCSTADKQQLSTSQGGQQQQGQEQSHEIRSRKITLRNPWHLKHEELRDVGNEQTKTTAELEANKSKNRYQSVLPYDHSIVKLTPIDSEPNSDYINANFIPGYSSLQEFICTQGPLRSTMTDFWRMVWEQNVRSVVMLTLCKEHGKVLCEPYWPALDSTQGYGQVEVTTLSQSCSQDWRVSQLKLYHSSTHTERRVSHFYYTAWPDCGVPRTPASMTSFTEHVREQLNKTEGAGPTVVHCSAGVGRTGTFITLDWLLQQLKSGSAVDVPGIVHKLRRSRCLMVQTLDQYIFIHTCLLLKITQEGQAAAHNQQIYFLYHELPSFNVTEDGGANQRPHKHFNHYAREPGSSPFMFIEN